MKKTGFLIVLMALICACSPQDEKEKYQSSRSNVAEVKRQVKEIDTGDVLIGNHSRMYLSSKHLIIADHQAYDKTIHLFDKNDFHPITSVGTIGQGPREITNLGAICVDEAKNKLYVTDHGKQKIFSYDVDSIITMPDTYIHQTKASFKSNQFPSNPIYINDTLSYGRVIAPTSPNSFDQMIGKWNMMTGELQTIGEKHPEVKNKRSLIDVSVEKGIIVEVYINHDLMNISDLDGNIQCYIYGPDWGQQGLETFEDVMITPNHILSTYSGGPWGRGRTEKIHVFDLKGNYQKTLNIGYNMLDCNYDKTQHRLYMVFDDEIQFGYLDLKDII